MRENVALWVEKPEYFFEIAKHMLYHLPYTGGNVVLPMEKSRNALFEYTISPYRSVNVGIYVKTDGFFRLVLSGVLKQWDTYDGTTYTNKLLSYDELAVRTFSSTGNRVTHCEFPQALGLHGYAKDQREYTEIIATFLNYQFLSTWIEFSLCEFDLSALVEWFPFYRVYLQELCQRNYFDDDVSDEKINARVITAGQKRINNILSESRARCDGNKWEPVNPFPPNLNGFENDLPQKVGGMFIAKDGRIENSKMQDVVDGKKLARSY